VHTVISQWKTQRVNSFSEVFATYSCSRPKLSQSVTELGPLVKFGSETCSCLKEEVQESAGQWLESLKWAFDYMLCWFVLNGGF
jgi:hypothetical protein